MITALTKWIAAVNQFITIGTIIPLILFLGTYYTVKLKFIQITKLKKSFKFLFTTNSHDKGNISHYDAVASVLACNLGTGNIAGMAVCLTTGGPGALIWMFIMTFFASTIQFASTLLGVKYRVKNAAGEYVGGPMYYMASKLNSKKLAIFFSIATIIASFFVGACSQVNSMLLPIVTICSTTPILVYIICAVTIAFFVSIVAFKGYEKIAHMSGTIVPIVALFYLAGILIIIAKFYYNLPGAFSSIGSMMFGGSLQSIKGGVLGFSIAQVIRTGCDRAVFATDSGTGNVSLLQSGAKTTDPVIDGVIAIIPPFIVVGMCTLSLLAFIVSGAYVSGETSTNMVMLAFKTGLGSKLGVPIVIISLLMFGYTTILAWITSFERAVEFLFGLKYTKIAKLIFVLLLVGSGAIPTELTWILADISITSMLLTNMLSLILLRKEVVKDALVFFQKESNK